MRIAVVDLPNSGKSQLCNSLTGTNALVSNYPQTTVAVTMDEEVTRSINVWLEGASSVPEEAPPRHGRPNFTKRGMALAPGRPRQGTLLGGGR